MRTHRLIPERQTGGNQNRPRTDNEFKQASLRSDIDLGSVTLTSITSYADLKFLTAQDQDGTDLVGLEIQRDDGRIKSFSQEVRLSNGASSGFRWVLGANYERTNVRQVTDLDSADSSSTIANGFTSSAYSSRNRMRNYAAFGNIEMDLADTITVKAGIRQTKAKRRYVGDTSDSARFPISTNPFTGAPGLSLTDFFNVIYGAIYGTRPDGTRVVPLLGPLDSIVIDNRVNPDGTPVNPATYLKTGPVPGRLNENSTSWSLGVDYKPSDSLLLYLNLSKGYKAGSFPHVSGAIVPAFEGVKQESVLDLEGGVKAQLLDRRLSISAGAFYYDYRNKQLRAKFVDPIFGGLDKLVNVPKSEIKGAEIEFQARPTQNLTFSGSATYLDAKVKKVHGRRWRAGRWRTPAAGSRVVRGRATAVFAKTELHGPGRLRSAVVGFTRGPCRRGHQWSVEFDGPALVARRGGIRHPVVDLPTERPDARQRQPGHKQRGRSLERYGLG
ncbi:TonB-dependent receptor domain-containing protein [Novosphingobium colocasiae]